MILTCTLTLEESVEPARESVATGFRPERIETDKQKTIIPSVPRAPDIRQVDGSSKLGRMFFKAVNNSLQLFVNIVVAFSKTRLKYLIVRAVKPQKVFLIWHNLATIRGDRGSGTILKHIFLFNIYATYRSTSAIKERKSCVGEAGGSQKLQWLIFYMLHSPAICKIRHQASRRNSTLTLSDNWLTLEPLERVGTVLNWLKNGL
eukprot:scaffold8194_cov118-Cylindrotheca_fusiformis.AAC.1